MCGISGIVNFKEMPVSEYEIRKVNDLIVHRGPDDEGYFLKDDFAFGHRRLAIIDLSENGAQPMHYKNNVIVFNGEIYNYLELRTELKAVGYAFNSNTDTEVILAAYDHWGEDCVKRFNGMWAFALYDSQRNIIFCSRDRFGIKPFYYTQTEGMFVFGSEIKQLLPFLEERKANQEVLMDYLVLSLEEHTDETFFEGVMKLPGGHNLVFDLREKKFNVEKYYILSCKDGPDEEKKSIELFTTRFQEAVSLRLRSDVKVGTCLSGGLDSSSIAAFASAKYLKKSKDKFSAVTACSIDSERDESHFASQVVEHLNLDWHKVTPQGSDFAEHIEELVRVQEEPFGGPSILMQYLVMQKAKEHNCTVMLDGQGGDEALLGYERYYPAQIGKRPIQMLKNLSKAAKNSKLKHSSLVKYYFYFTSPAVRKFSLKRRSKSIRKEFMDKVRFSYLDEMAGKYSSVKELQKYELQVTQLPHLLKYEDKNSMAHSIEARLPFLDHNLVETSVGLDDSMKIKGGWTKYILRKTVDKLLPSSIVWRKNKFGFEAPEETWFKENEKLIFEVIGNSKICNAVFSSFKNLTKKTIWKLYFLSLWEKEFNVQM